MNYESKSISEQTLGDCEGWELGTLWPMGSQRVRCNLATEQQQQKTSDLYKNEKGTGWDWLNIYSMMRIYVSIYKNYKRLNLFLSLCSASLLKTH